MFFSCVPLGEIRSAGGAMIAKRQDIADHDELRVARDRIAERDVDTEPLSHEFALGAEPEPVVVHAVGPDLGVLAIGADLECDEVAQVATPGRLEPCDQVVR